MVWSEKLAEKLWDWDDVVYEDDRYLCVLSPVRLDDQPCVIISKRSGRVYFRILRCEGFFIPFPRTIKAVYQTKEELMEELRALPAMVFMSSKVKCKRFIEEVREFFRRVKLAPWTVTYEEVLFTKILSLWTLERLVYGSLIWIFVWVIQRAIHELCRRRMYNALQNLYDTLERRAKYSSFFRLLLFLLRTK